MYHKISGYYLDSEQIKIVEDDSKYLLVTAGAGSGKTLTILGKLNYLINNKKVDKNEIICISFTKASKESLEIKIKKEFNLDISVYTFHKLSLEILKMHKIKYTITDPDTLDNIIYEFIYVKILNNEKFMKLVLKYFKVKYKNKQQYLLYIKQHTEELTIFINFLSTFIHLFKCNGFILNDFNQILKKIKKNVLNYRNNKLVLMLALNIYILYENYLKENNEIDFDDMLIMANECVIKKGFKRKIKYIIIDEYQDTSYIRFNLIKTILDKTNSSLMVVGDDFQSIYKFTGCDISLFLDFKKYFKDAKIMKIENTYRNSQELIKVAGNFVMKNKSQIKKNLKSYKHLSKPIKIAFYTNIKLKLKEIILKIYKETNKPILILGRNNKDINSVLDKKYFKYINNKIIYLNNKNIKITYLTSHKSKGLEEENVIIIGLEDKILGFPNKIKDNKILKYVSKNKEKYPYAEERRLFYVALTRTKNNVYLLVPYKNESIFVKELKKSYEKEIEYI